MFCLESHDREVTIQSEYIGYQETSSLFFVKTILWFRLFSLTFYPTRNIALAEWSVENKNFLDFRILSGTKLDLSFRFT